MKTVLMPTFHMEENDILGLIDYRTQCCEADLEGAVYYRGTYYPVNRYGVMMSEPTVLEEYHRKTSELLRRQMNKRKMERNGSPSP